MLRFISHISIAVTITISSLLLVLITEGMLEALLGSLVPMLLEYFK